MRRGHRLRVGVQALTWERSRLGAWIGLLAAAAASPAFADMRPADFGALSIEELGNVEITSVSKTPEPLSQAPAAIYVITSDAILRSGAPSLPEALRLAPNLQVSRIDSLGYAISARGFNSFQAANKLLVMIDGRSVYTPLHSGVYWDALNVMLDDLDRIEVVSGPGGTLWGANAVNGVINIISKSSADTQGVLIDAVAGNLERRVSARLGGKLGDAATWRVYGLGFQREGTLVIPGLSDGGKGAQGGFRLDRATTHDTFTLQGDIYRNTVDYDPIGDLHGWNLTGRWTHALGEDSELQLQAYYDVARRSLIGVLDRLDTIDIEGQHNFRLGKGHEIVWGAGFRSTRDKFDNGLNFFVLDPPGRRVNLGNVFAQDKVALGSALDLTLGVKVDISSFTGAELLPSARLAWRPSESSLLWAAISRAVRTPSRIDRSLVAAGFLVAGTFESERLVAYEAGYRGRPFEHATISVSLFYNDYDKLRTTELTGGVGLPVFLGNGLTGHTYGVEAWGGYDVNDHWRLSAGVSALHKSFHLKPGHTDVSGRESLGDDPEYQFQLRSQATLWSLLEFDVALRGVGQLTTPAVPGYVEADAHLGLRITPTLLLSIDGLNLLHDSHSEMVNNGSRAQVRRSVYAGLRWRF